MRIRLALGLPVLLLLQACAASGGSVWAVDAGSYRRSPGYAVPYGYYPYGRFEPSPFYGRRPVFPYGHPQRCVRDRWGRLWC